MESMSQQGSRVPSLPWVAQGTKGGQKFYLILKNEQEFDKALEVKTILPADAWKGERYGVIGDLTTPQFRWDIECERECPSMSTEE